MLLMSMSSWFVAGPPSSGSGLLGRRGSRLGDYSRAGYFRWGRYPLGDGFPYARNRSSQLVAVILVVNARPRNGVGVLITSVCTRNHLF